jgi:hypothetical protein
MTAHPPSSTRVALPRPPGASRCYNPPRAATTASQSVLETPAPRGRRDAGRIARRATAVGRPDSHRPRGTRRDARRFRILVRMGVAAALRAACVRRGTRGSPRPRHGRRPAHARRARTHRPRPPPRRHRALSPHPLRGHAPQDRHPLGSREPRAPRPARPPWPRLRATQCRAYRRRAPVRPARGDARIHRPQALLGALRAGRPSFRFGTRSRRSSACSTSSWRA